MKSLEEKFHCPQMARNDDRVLSIIPHSCGIQTQVLALNLVLAFKKRSVSSARLLSLDGVKEPNYGSCTFACA